NPLQPIAPDPTPAPASTVYIHSSYDTERRAFDYALYVPHGMSQTFECRIEPGLIGYTLYQVDLWLDEEHWFRSQGTMVATKWWHGIGCRVTAFGATSIAFEIINENDTTNQLIACLAPTFSNQQQGGIRLLG